MIKSKARYLIARMPTNIIFIFIILIMTCLIQGCSDKDGYQYIDGEPHTKSKLERRTFSINLITPSWSGVWCQSVEKLCVIVGEGGNIKRSLDWGKTWSSEASNSDSSLFAIYGDSHQLVAVGEKGTIIRSDDHGHTWKVIPLDLNVKLTAIYGDDEQLVVVGDGHILRSANGGKNWDHVLNRGLRFNAIHGERTLEGTRLVAVSITGVIMRSMNGGLSWTEEVSNTDESLNAIHGNSKRLIAVGNSGTIISSDNGGVTWNKRESNTEGDLISIKGAGDRLVALSDGFIIRSEDGGIHWDKVVNNNEGYFNYIYDAGEWLVAIGMGEIWRSDDNGITWNNKDIGTNANLSTLYGDGPNLVAVGESGSIFISEDSGQTWTASDGLHHSTKGAIYCDGDLIVVAGDNGVIAQSNDAGKSWVNRISGTNSNFRAVYGLGNILLAAGSDGTIVRSSDGGESWKLVHSGSEFWLRAIYGDGEKLIAVGDDGTIVRSSNNGNNWKTVNRGIDHILVAIHGNGKRLVAVGDGGAILRSNDGGSSWALVDTGTNSRIQAVYGKDERFIAVGDYGMIFLSKDGGEHWAVVTSNSETHFNGIHGNETSLIAVGDKGVIMRSEDDGESWNIVNSGTKADLKAIYGLGDRLISVGTKGTIVHSDDDGRSWFIDTSGTKARFNSISGGTNRLAVLGKYGAILVLNEDGNLMPMLKEIGYRSLPNDLGQLRLRLKLDDPDEMCLESTNCKLEAMGRNEVDFKNHRNLNQVQLNRIDSVWEGVVDPKNFSLAAGEKFFLEVMIKGSNFSLHYPIDKRAFLIPYLVDPRLTYTALTVGVLFFILIILYWFNPLSLLGLYRRLGIFEGVQKLNMPSWVEGFQVAMQATVLPWLITRPRVLDAWIEKNIDIWKKVFEEEDAVMRLHYYPLPLRRSETQLVVRHPRPQDFINDFLSSHTLLQVIGSGGSGKTSFAAQLGSWGLAKKLTNHVMVPMWLDEDVTDVRLWLVRRVREIVRDDDLPESFVHALFKTKRILLIVDRLSERQPISVEAMKHLPGWLGSAVFTTRYKINLNQANVKYIEPIGLGAESLMSFIEELVESSDNGFVLKDIKTQGDLFRSLANTITINGVEEKITPLLVTLFVKKALIQMLDDTSLNVFESMPANIPDVYFEYLCSINPSDESSKNYLPKEKMLLAAGILACVEMGDDFRPKRVDQQEAEKALKKESLLGDELKPLQRLLDNQVLEQRQVGGGYMITFALDPVAEYLAAFAHANRCGNNVDSWRELIEKVTELGEQASGFMSALRIVHQVYAKKYGWTQLTTFPTSGKNLEM